MDISVEANKRIVYIFLFFHIFNFFVIITAICFLFKYKREYLENISSLEDKISVIQEDNLNIKNKILNIEYENNKLETEVQDLSSNLNSFKEDKETKEDEIYDINERVISLEENTNSYILEDEFNEIINNIRDSIDTLSIKINNLSSSKSDYSKFINYEGMISSFYKKSINNNYLKIPENIRNNLETNSWRIVVTTNNFGKNYGYSGNILALTVYGEKTIYISVKDSSSIIHEVGHFLDYSLGRVSSFPEFVDIFTEESGTLTLFHKTHEDNYSTALEYFAESFQEYILHPNDLQNFCPKTYEYIDNLSKNF